MTALRPFRFGVITSGAQSREEWVNKAQEIEQYGYTSLLVPDHLGEQFSPALALLAAAEATRALHVGSYVFANDFRSPVLLAREAATLDVLTDGRFELGLGTGYQRAEYEQAGLSYDPANIRVSRLEEALHVIKGLFGEEPVNFSGKYYTINNLRGAPRPVQQPHPPLLVGGAGKRLLSLAAREADIVSLAARALPDGSGLEVADISPAATLQKIEWIRQAAGARFDQLELNMIIFASVITENRDQAVQQLTTELKITADQVLATPHVLVGSIDQVCVDLQARREQYGISYISIFEPSMEAFAPVVARLNGR